VDSIWIKGGNPLKGEIPISGAKNAALTLMPCALLTEEKVTLANLPRLADVDTFSHLLNQLGVSTSVAGVKKGQIGRRMTLQANDIASTVAPYDMVRKMRASVLVLGPMLARMGEATVSLPGGCAIGDRPIDLHLKALECMGAEIELTAGYVKASAPKGRLAGGDFSFPVVSVGATENALMAAVLAKGKTQLFNAAREPEIVDLCEMLVAMGAEIGGIGSNVLTVEGQAELHGCEHTVGPDHIEVGSFMALAGVTGGELRITGTLPGDLRMIRLVFDQLGLFSELDGDDVLVPGEQQLIIKRDAGEYKSKIQDGPWPAFPADLTSIAVALATQCAGSVLIHEWMFENRLVFTDKLISMGADIVLCDPHRAIVTGPARLRGERLSSPDIRAGMSMLIAALSATGESVIQNVREIDRGYENIDVRLRNLGARIQRIAAEDQTPAMHT